MLYLTIILGYREKYNIDIYVDVNRWLHTFNYFTILLKKNFYFESKVHDNFRDLTVIKKCSQIFIFYGFFFIDNHTRNCEIHSIIIDSTRHKKKMNKLCTVKVYCINVK